MSAPRKSARLEDVSGGLQATGDGGGVARCVRCGAVAVGPCASCHEPVCGDCCVLTEGGVKIYAICLACEDRRGRSLQGGWGGFLRWLAVPMVALLALVALLTYLDAK
jgi:hypothetical protein